MNDNWRRRVGEEKQEGEEEEDEVDNWRRIRTGGVGKQEEKERCRRRIRRRIRKTLEVEFEDDWRREITGAGKSLDIRITGEEELAEE